MTHSRYRALDNAYPHFLTCSIVGWLPVFTRPAVVEIIFASWRFLQRSKRLTIFSFVVLENQLRLIASSADLAKEIGDFRSYTARQFIDHLTAVGDATVLKQLHWHRARHKADRPYQLWQEGSHPQAIGSEEMMWQKLTYIHENPVRRGYVDDPLHWRYSSARNYARQSSLLEVTTQW